MNRFQHKKSLGQNFLVDENVIHKIVDSSMLDDDTVVIEIGPGEGAITKEIVPRCKYSFLYEIDGRLEESLKELLKGYNNYSLIIGDFLKRDVKCDLDGYSFSKLCVVSNLPYYITTPIIMKLIDDDILPDKIIIMVQKEVALRFAAKPGSREYGSFTVLLNYFYNVNKLFDVSKNCFVPKPDVDSSVVCMEKKNKQFFVKDVLFFKKLVRDCFASKRKTIKNNLREYSLDVVSSVLKKYGYSLDVRAEKLSLEVFVELANTLLKEK